METYKFGLDSKRKSFGLYESALATLLFIVFNIVFLMFYRMIPVSVRGSGSVIYYIASFMIEALFGVTAYVVAYSRKVDFKTAVGADKKVNGNIIFYAILISFVCLIFFGNLTNSFIELLNLFGYSSVLGSLEIDNFGIYLVYIVTTCITPAICEEILFRGVIASGFKEKGFFVALVSSSIIFTLMHGNPEQTVHQFIIGFVIGYIFLKTGNIWIGVIVHFMNNFIAVTITYVSSLIYSEELVAEAQETVATQSTASSFMINLFIAVLMAFVGYLIIKRLIKAVEEENNKLNLISTENSTIVVDETEVKVEMTLDGEKLEEKNSSIQGNLPKTEKEKMPLSVIIMFAISGAYFVIEWLSSLLTGLGF